MSLPTYVRFARALALAAPLAAPVSAIVLVAPPTRAQPPCPARRPAEGSACGRARRDQTCSYRPRWFCSCENHRGGSRLTWHCELPRVTGPLPPPELPA